MGLFVICSYPEGDTSFKSSTTTNKCFVSIHKTAFETIPWKRQESEQGFPTNFDLVMGSPWFHVHPKVLTGSPSKWWKHQGAVEKKSWCKLLIDGRILDWAHAAKWAPRKFHFSCLQWEHMRAFVGIQLCSKLPTGPSLQRISQNGRLNWNSACLTPSALHNHQHSFKYSGSIYGISLIVYNLNLYSNSVILLNSNMYNMYTLYIYMEILPKIFLQDSQCHQGSLEGSTLSPPGWL